MDKDFFNNLSSSWERGHTARTDYLRRQILLEIDVIVAQMLGLSFDELLTLYKVQFPVMQFYENNTWYDQKGRIVFTKSRGKIGVGFPSKGSGFGEKRKLGWSDICDMKTGTVSKMINDNVNDENFSEREIIYQAPFDCPNRILDYKLAWKFFERKNNY